MWSLIPILISKIGDFQLPPKSDSLFIQLMLNEFSSNGIKIIHTKIAHVEFSETEIYQPNNTNSILATPNNALLLSSLTDQLLAR